MKKIISLYVVFLLLLVPAVYAQTAKIVGIKGEVFVRKEDTATWEQAEVGMFVDGQAQLRTEQSSECNLALDKTFKNILTVKENSRIKINTIQPASIELPKGRVLSLIDDITKVEQFEIKTPTAIAGVKGTGLEVDFLGERTSVMCFEDRVYLQGLDEQGNIISEKELENGFGAEVDKRGEIGDFFELRDVNYADWDEFRGNIENIRQEIETGEKTTEQTAPKNPPAVTATTEEEKNVKPQEEIP
ncbi:MAG: FecR domain-containing protein, partial [Candidatus Omnitrophota bacterium]